MKIKNTFWIYLILIFNFQSFGHCYDDFTYRKFPIIHNQPRIYLDKILEITNTDNELRRYNLTMHKWQLIFKCK